MERLNIHAQMEHLQMKYQGTGHADTTKYEWVTEMHRDTLASHVSHHSRLMYMSLAENESIARVRFNCLEKMIQPCGPPPKAPEADVEMP
jgi:splicing factor 3B subunit 5